MIFNNTSTSQMQCKAWLILGKQEFGNKHYSRFLFRMEPSFVSNPYVQASAPASHHIREILDREEASYVSWRKARKPVRLPHASTKLNAPLKTLTDRHFDSNQIKTSAAPKSPGADVELTPDVAGPNKSRSQSVTHQSMASKRKGAIVAGFTRSVESLPSLSGNPDTRQKQVPFGQATDRPNKHLDGAIIPSLAPRRAERRRFQQYLYDFHSRQVFSYAKCETEALEDAATLENAKIFSVSGDLADDGSAHTSSGDGFSGRSLSSEDCPRQEFNKRQNECLLNGLGFLSPADYDAIFETDWRLSDAERVVRDAVDRKRIREILKKAYRMLLWFFRYYAGNAACAAASERRSRMTSVVPLGEELFEIPSRLRLLEDLNVQSIDPARFGVTDSPLKRENLIDFLLNVARMACTHSSDPNHLRTVVNEGIEMSDAVRTLVRDHFGVFAQIQDVDHFRLLFLRNPEAFARLAQRGAISRRLHAIIEIHKLNLANLFDELVSSGVLPRSGNAHEKTKAQQRPRGNGIACTQFLFTLRAINLIIGSGTTVAATIKTDGEAPANGVDEVRAVRIFLSCLPMATIDYHESEGATKTVTGAASFEPRELTLFQFIEALLRVAFTWKELQICAGKFDVCNLQLTSDCCQCALDSARYAFDVFDDAVEEIFMRIHAYRLGRSQLRTSMRLKSIVKSHRSLRSLVALTTAQKAPSRVLPVDE